MTEVRQEDGYLDVTLKTAPTVSWLLPLECEQELVAKWQAGAAWWSGPGLYGGVIHLKLSDVVCVQRCTAEALAARRNDDRQRAVTE